MRMKRGSDKMQIINMIARTPAGNFNTSASRRNAFGVDTVTFHTTGNTTQSAINTIINPANQVSYHFIIDNQGNVTQHVNMAHIAFHAGTQTTNPALNNYLGHSTSEIFRQRRVNHNDYSIGIAFGDTFGMMPNAVQFLSAAQLLEHIKQTYTIRHLTTHSIVHPRSRINDPVTPANMPTFWANLDRAMMSLINDDIEHDVGETRYNSVGELPEWAKPAIERLIERGLLLGDGATLNLSEDMVRIFVIHFRAGLYDERKEGLQWHFQSV